MASWQLIESAGRTLVRLLQMHVDSVLPLANVDVQLATTKLFKSLESTARPAITILLYRVIDNPEMRNAPLRTLPGGATARPLLPLELCYLVTTWGVRRDDSPLADSLAAREAHRLLGVALQAFYDHAEISRAELLEAPGEQIWTSVDCAQLFLETLPLEDHYVIWDSGELDYRVSLTYRLRIVGLEPSTRDANSRVVISTQSYRSGV